MGISLTGTPAEPLAGRGARPGRTGSPGTSATRARARPQNPCEGRVWAALPLYTPLTPFLLGGLVKLNPCGGRSAAGAMAIIKKQKQTNKKPETTRAGGTWRGVGGASRSRRERRRGGRRARSVRALHAMKRGPARQPVSPGAPRRQLRAAPERRGGTESTAGRR